MSRQSNETARYFRISFTLALLSNQIAFQGSRLFEKGRFHADLTLPADAVIPFLPWTITIYVGCFLFWLILYSMIARLPRQEADRFFCANVLGKGISFIVFVLFPTTMSRPELGGGTVWIALMRILYVIDAPDNLFPSLHCMIAWLCWIGVRGNKQVPLPWRISALIMAVLVCLSTLTTRQHVVLDVFGGILLSKFCYSLSDLPALRKPYACLIDCLTHCLLSIRNKVLS